MSAVNSASRTIEITVLSAENLQFRGKPIKKSQSNLFVTVRSDRKSDDSASTKIDRDGAGFPQWNEKLLVHLPMNSVFVSVEICRRASERKIEIVGAVRVPVKDFTAGYVPESYLQFLSYRLRDVRGQRNGVVNLSVKVQVAAGIEVSAESS